MDLVSIAKVIWRKAWLLLLIPAIAAGTAWLLTTHMRDTYKASAQLSTGFMINDQVQLNDEKFNIRDADIKFSNLLNLMNSGLSYNLLSYKLLSHDLDPALVPYHQPEGEGFTKNPKEAALVRKLVQQKLDSMKPLTTVDPDFDLIRKYLEAYRYSYNNLKKNVNIVRVPNTDYLLVEVSTDRPSLSAFAANSFASEFLRYHQSLRSERTGESVEFLRQTVSQRKADLDRKLDQQKTFKSSNNVLDVQGESGIKFSQMAELERQRDELRGRVQRADLNVRRIRTELKKLSSPGGSPDNQKILAVKSKINRLNERYITTGSNNMQLLDSLDMLRDQLQQLTETSNRQGSVLPSGTTKADLQYQLTEAEIEYEVERDNLSNVESQMRNIRASISGYAGKEARLSAIQREVDLANEEYLAAVEKYNEARNKLASTNLLRQVLVATPPVGPEFSKRYIIVALSGVASFLLCLFAIVAMELIDGSIRTPERFKKLVGLPLIGNVIRIDSRNFNIRSYFNQQNGNDETEMFKSLMRKLRHDVESLGARVILFTSPKRKDGKTFVMFSLAYVLSLINKRVLIIDTNFKNNSLSQLLGRNQSDLKVLDGKKHKMLAAAHGHRYSEEEFDRENSYDLINPTRYKNIYIVGNAGSGHESAAEILSGRDFSNLISMLSDSFDYILLEGAALNDYSDTRELSRYADKVVAVFNADSGVRQLDRESIQYLKSLGKKFGGAVLNRVDPKDMKL